MTEVWGATLLDLSGGTRETPVELLAALKWRPIDGLSVVAGGGAGLVRGYGAGRGRAFLGVSYDFSVVRKDGDADGVADEADLCPTQREDRDGYRDTDGCPDPDNDGDGIADARDKCPLYYGDGAEGCPELARRDADGDGFDDARDACPTEAEDKDGYLDDDGCPDLDNDGDGLVDASDKCPNRPETVNGFQDKDGCPDKAVARKLTIPEVIRFPDQGTALAAAAKQQLIKIAQRIAAHPDRTVRFRVEGHADNRGNAKAQYARSLAYARAVADFLAAQGIARDRLQAVGYGAKRPLKPNTTAAGRAANRRVQVISLTR